MKKLLLLAVLGSFFSLTTTTSSAFVSGDCEQAENHPGDTLVLHFKCSLDIEETTAVPNVDKIRVRSLTEGQNRECWNGTLSTASTDWLESANDYPNWAGSIVIHNISIDVDVEKYWDGGDSSTNPVTPATLRHWDPQLAHTGKFEFRLSGTWGVWTPPPPADLTKAFVLWTPSPCDNLPPI
mgnify:CR=1 FL=1